MKILDSTQIRAADAYTIAHEPIASIDLMERAAYSCALWIRENIDLDLPVMVFCGPGNNGGDGLALARMLHAWETPVQVLLLPADRHSTDYQINVERLQKTGVRIRSLQVDQLPEVLPETIVIDALFGTGLQRPLDGYPATLVEYITQQATTIIAIDMPSGLGDQFTPKHPCIRADFTLTFQVPKLVQLLPDSGVFCGQLQVLDIGLNPAFIEQQESIYHFTTRHDITHLLLKRATFGHKGTYGHALLLAGSSGKYGAAVLTTRTALRSGCGLVSCGIPGSGLGILQSSCPEAMVILSKTNDHLSGEFDFTAYRAVGIGPGIGTHPETVSSLFEWIKAYHNPMVLDADALNILALHPDWLQHLPQGSILTPHPGEFARLFGTFETDAERINCLQRKAIELKLIIILKGAYTAIALPDGTIWFNSSGNPGMAKGGSGDTLTGLLTGLLARGYASREAAILGVYLHGRAGDLAAQHLGMEAMNAGDLITYLPDAFREVVS